MTVKLTADQLQRFHENGYVIVPGVFTSEEIAGLRDGAYAAAAEAGMRPEDAETVTGFALPGDVASNPHLGHLVTDARIVSIAEQLLGAPPVHFRDSAVGIGGTERGWHKDNRNSDRYDTTQPDWDGDYPMVRMGIYCEDHVSHSGGLGVRVGSHLPRETLRTKAAKLRWGLVQRVRNGSYVKTLATGMLATGKPVHVPSRPGDLVAWNMRITHSGHSVRLKHLPQLKLPPFMESRIPKALTRPDERQRVAVFLTYGADSPHLWRYIEYLKGRAYFPGRTKDRPLADDVVAALAEQPSLRIVDPWTVTEPAAAAMPS